LLNTVAVFKSPSFERGEEQYGGVDELQAAYKDCVPAVQEALKNLATGIRWPLYDRTPIENWVSGRMALIGDAAHPMLPFLAQGAAQAFEDAAALALCLRDGDPAAGVARYERVRLDRVSELQRRSRGRPEVYHLPDGPEQRRRDAELAAEDRLGHASWLYAYDAEAAVRGPGVAAG